jgi:hypothetical protein
VHAFHQAPNQTPRAELKSAKEKQEIWLAVPVTGANAVAAIGDILRHPSKRLAQGFSSSFYIWVHHHHITQSK